MTRVEVSVLIPERPAVADLYFWALQVSFAGSEGRTGGAHLGLQWHRGHPGSTAVNWGGYDQQGSILHGSDSSLPSALSNPHTRDYPWESGRPYRLAVAADRARGEGWWSGSIVDVDRGIETEVRSLYSQGHWLADAMVWTEAFCRCDAPPVVALWSDPLGVRLDGSLHRPEAVSLTYQRESDGGCSNTDSYELGGGLAQVTGVTRTNQAGAVLRWP
jgi:hypothetical protein